MRASGESPPPPRGYRKLTVSPNGPYGLLKRVEVAVSSSQVSTPSGGLKLANTFALPKTSQSWTVTPATTAGTRQAASPVSEFPLERIPFGALVDFMPQPDMKLEAMGAKTTPGVFVGCHVGPGGRWSGDCLVADYAPFKKYRDV